MLRLRFFARVFLILVLIFSSLGLAQTAGSSSLNDPFYPWMGNGGYDALDYDIQLKIPENPISESGNTTMTAIATQDLSSFNLDFGAMEVSTVTVNGTVARFEHNDPELMIVPEKPLAKDKTFKVNVVFKGRPFSVVNANTIGYIWNLAGSDGLSVFSQPSMTMAWTPINDTPADKATFTLRITAAKDQTVAANGQLISRLENPDLTATSTFRIATPTTTYMLVFAVGDFQFDDAGTIDGVHYRNYLSRTTSDTFAGYIHQVPKIMKYLVDRLGKYPFDEFGVLTTNTFPSGSALETQSLISMRPAYYNQDASEDTEGEQETLAHEMTHQWFGALVTYTDHGQTFLHEGFAEYFGFTYINDTLNSNYLQERFVSIYPRLVAGQWTYKQSKSVFLESMRSYFGYSELSGEKVGIVLDGFFGSSLSAESRQRILERVKAGFQPSDLADALEELQFTQVIFTAKTYSEILNLLGQSYFLDFWERTRLTPPGKFANDDYVLNIGVYWRGAMTLHALRLKTGDELFFEILRTYLERYKFSNASNTDFVNIVNEMAGADTKTFLEAWLYDDQVPDFPEMNLYAKDFQLGADFK